MIREDFVLSLFSAHVTSCRILISTPAWFGEWKFHVCTGWGRGPGSDFATPCFQLYSVDPHFQSNLVLLIPKPLRAWIHVGFSPCGSLAERRKLKCNPVTLPHFLSIFLSFVDFSLALFLSLLICS